MLTAFQLRVARDILGLGLREFGQYLNVSRTTVFKWEHQPNLNLIHTVTKVKNVILIKPFFEEHGIVFPNENTISLKSDIVPIPNTGALTRFQLRAARTAAHLTQEKLSEDLMIPRIVLNYLERQKNLTYLNTTPKKVDELLIKNIFEKHGIVFPNDFSISLKPKN